MSLFDSLNGKIKTPMIWDVDFQSWEWLDTQSLVSIVCSHDLVCLWDELGVLV